MGGATTTSTQHPFAGTAKRTRTVHETPHASAVIEKRHVYDESGRRVRTWRSHNEDEEVLVTERKYNELGTLIERRLHSTDTNPGDPLGAGTFTQRVDLQRNVRGWLTEKNYDGESEGDLFNMRLRYTDLLGNAGAEAQYDGQVASMAWSIHGDSLAHIYGYEYDALGRLVEADYSSMGPGPDQSGRFTVDTLRYDLNGNLTHIRRRGRPG